MDRELLKQYADNLSQCIQEIPISSIESLAIALEKTRTVDQRVWICGNGGSCATAIHWANDFLYPVVKYGGKGLRIQALSGNSAVLTCLGNDIGYDKIFSTQLETNAHSGDLLIVLSGSGNSPNILRALEAGQDLGMKTFAIVGFDGGKAKELADEVIHFEVHDMQLAEDLQMVVCHMLVKYLYQAFRKNSPFPQHVSQQGSPV